MYFLLKIKYFQFLYLLIIIFKNYYCENISYENLLIPTNQSINANRCVIMKLKNVSYMPDLNLISIKFKKKLLVRYVEMGGLFRPSCLPLQNVAIIVPYRNRPDQLNQFSYNLHRFLKKQNIVNYQIFIVEQNDTNQFNRAKLLNIGFREAMKIRPFDCFIFHDIELIPTNYKNLYLCSSTPRHMSYNIHLFNNFYDKLFGGVCSILAKQFVKANGYSNKFFGWGGEDDEFRERLIRQGYQIKRLPFSISTYIKLEHDKDKLNDPNPNRFKLIAMGKLASTKDGLNSLKYKLFDIQFKTLYTSILVDLT